MNLKTAASANIFCLGDSWFPTSPGGLDRYVYELCGALAHGQDQVELMGVGLPERSANSSIKLLNIGQSERSLPQRLLQTRSRFLRRQLQHLNALNLHFALYSLPIVWRRPKDVPITFSFHGPWALESDREGGSKLGIIAKRWIEHQVYKRCDRFIVLSKAFGHVLHQTYGIPWQKIHIIPGGVNTNSFQISMSRQQARAKMNWPADQFIIFTPRRLVHRMGIDRLLTALSEIKQSVPEKRIFLAVAGKGPLRQDLEAQTAVLGLQEHVRFLGFLPDADLPTAYQAADLTVIPSQSLEGFGLILLESLACGTPAMCTPVGGMPEVLSEFSPELITDSSEAEMIAQKLSRIIAGDLVLPSRQRCYDYATNNFSWDIISQRVRQVLLSPV